MLNSMSRIPVIAVFDVGKTNKKIFLFDETYRKVHEETLQLNETIDEDGDACEDLALLSDWLRIGFEKVMKLPLFEVKAVNFSAYGASFVHLTEPGKSVLPLYNYLKPFPKQLQDEFYNTYGGESKIAKETASPVLGSLNSGLQLYRIKKEKPEVFKNIRRSLHLPQYLSYLITNQEFSDLTSIGCHTLLWHFEKAQYHHWVYNEGIDSKLAVIKKGNEACALIYGGQNILAGIGLHDSSSALIPYLINFKEPFVLVSTGTWCISLNPFNNAPLTSEELNNDCLCYIQYQGLPVKASRVFAGHEHEREIEQLAVLFSKPLDYYKQVCYSEVLVKRIEEEQVFKKAGNEFTPLLPEDFDTYEKAYHFVMLRIMAKQVASTQLVLKGTGVKRIFVDGGFSRNPIYMNLLATAFPEVEVFAAAMAQATAIGAALAIHHKWNRQPVPGDIIELKMYTVPNK